MCELCFLVPETNASHKKSPAPDVTNDGQVKNADSGRTSCARMACRTHATWTRPVASEPLPAPALHGREPSPGRAFVRQVSSSTNGTNRGHSNPSATGDGLLSKAATCEASEDGSSPHAPADDHHPKLPFATEPTSAQTTTRGSEFMRSNDQAQRPPGREQGTQ